MYVVLPFGQTPCPSPNRSRWFEYMSYYLFGQTYSSRTTTRRGLNICRITFWSNFQRLGRFRDRFEYMSYYLLVKLYA